MWRRFLESVEAALTASAFAEVGELDTARELAEAPGVPGRRGCSSPASRRRVAARSKGSLRLVWSECASPPVRSERRRRGSGGQPAGQG
jgi:hypothetical protein